MGGLVGAWAHLRDTDVVEYAAHGQQNSVFYSNNEWEGNSGGRQLQVRSSGLTATHKEA